MKNFIIGTLIGFVGGFCYGGLCGTKAQEKSDCDLIDSYTKGLNDAIGMMDIVNNSDQTETKEEITDEQSC